MRKIFISTIVILLLSIIIAVFLYGTHAVGIGTVTQNPEGYIQGGGNEGELINIGNIIVGIVRAFGIAISVLMLTIIGIKYIMGSVQEKAEYKQTMWPYIIGAILIFAGAEVTNIIYNAVH